MIQIFRMLISLGITLGIVFYVREKKERIVPVCIIYYLVKVLNDIFNAGRPVELANTFGISYQFEDTLILILIGSILFSIKNHYIKINFLKSITWILFFILFMQTLAGIIKYGPSAEWMGDIRTLYLFIIPIIYFARYFKIEYIYKYRKLIDRVMIIIVCISVTIWILDIGFNFKPLLSQYYATLSDGGSTMRFIHPQQLIGLLVYTLVLTRESIQKKGCIEIKASIFILIVFLFQHRSIWMALFFGILFIILQECKERKNRIKILGQVLIISMAGIFCLIISDSSIVNNIVTSLNLLINMITGGSIGNSTANTRVLVWEATINDLKGLSIIFGRPFGYGYAESIGWSTSPHSGYIRMLGRTGYLGLLILTLILLFTFNKLRKNKIIYGPEFILAIAAFMYSYDFNWSCGVIIGACIAYIYSGKKQKSSKLNITT